MTLLDGVRAALWEEMERDDSVVLMGEDVALKGGVFRVTQGFLDHFGPLRVVDTPIAEGAIAGIGIGAGFAGLRPVLEFQFADYSHPALDQIVNQAAMIRYRSVGDWHCPLVFRAPFGAGVGGGLYHSQSVEALYCHLPGVKVVVPATAADARGLLKSAIRDDDPVVFIEGEMLYNAKGEVPEEPEFLIPLGKAEVKRAGTDVTIICHSKTVNVALKAAEQLAAENIQAEVVDLRTIRPLDTETVLASVAKTNRAVVLEEGWTFAGVGAQVVDLIQREAFDLLDAPVIRVTGADVPMPYNKLLERAAKVDPAKAVAAAKRVLYLA
jgi:pyruvate dehydrogenase E1 component beta subunit